MNSPRNLSKSPRTSSSFSQPKVFDPLQIFSGVEHPALSSSSPSVSRAPPLVVSLFSAIRCVSDQAIAPPLSPRCKEAARGRNQAEELPITRSPSSSSSPAAGSPLRFLVLGTTVGWSYRRRHTDFCRRRNILHAVIAIQASPAHVRPSVSLQERRSPVATHACTHSHRMKTSRSLTCLSMPRTTSACATVSADSDHRSPRDHHHQLRHLPLYIFLFSPRRLSRRRSPSPPPQRSPAASALSLLLLFLS
ncbi:uncharacterized protein [Oryza sativa Japonica Group]|uniref:Expressed protein n=2 Tax=Oryza sativa subsp. japonica TaxID=39947 RepID=Q10A18_ORYSJ|nr:uncharacterized protein LOC4348207 [Oryza sativa Japonica Group]ABG65943.1 expressed protein [Oryza sativa Japonica Group]BAF26164.1 Os10g0181100 [Oryza sativa Japonica Group]BAG98402.1 unnamed protein product [Oryza sativa Japonica Group]BAT10120.1 Os10g0181100 [Oryza sativa Japonica Group]|eukprot:NP_001064250.1 Os10g0181100 [Oryza sativa Japonica Group]